MAEWRGTGLVGIGSSQEGQSLMNPLHPVHLSATERRTEVCANLAAACCACGRAGATDDPGICRRVRFPSRNTRAVMRTRTLGEPHDRSHPRMTGGAEDRLYVRSQGPVARTV